LNVFIPQKETWYPTVVRHRWCINRLSRDAGTYSERYDREDDNANTESS
jgi:hypothetical protein